METLQAIQTRRSIRKYSATAVSDKDVEAIICAGLSAPSATNRRPIHIVVIKNKLTMKALSIVNTHARMLDSAPLCFAIVADTTLQPVKDFYINDGSAAIENMLLAAHDLGLGAVWLGVIHMQEWYHTIFTLLKLPANFVPIGFISVGHPDEVKAIENHFDPSKIHIETF
jgi:nitroreductase